MNYGNPRNAIYDNPLFHWPGFEAEQYHDDWPEGMLLAVPEVDLTDMQAEYE